MSTHRTTIDATTGQPPEPILDAFLTCAYASATGTA